MSVVAEIATISHLPTLIDRAASALTSARSAAEVLVAKEMAGVAYNASKLAGRLAKAKDAHASVTAAALRAQADANEIIAQAQRCLADEYDAAQDRGEVAKLGSNQTQVGVPVGNTLPTAADIGLTRKDIHEARIIRDAEKAEPGIVRRALDEMLERGEEPTKAALRKVATEVARPEAAAKQAEEAKRKSSVKEAGDRAEAHADAKRRKEFEQAVNDRAREDPSAAPLPPPDQFAAFISLVDQIEAFRIADLVQSAGRRRSVLGQRASGLVDFASSIMEALDQ